MIFLNINLWPVLLSAVLAMVVGAIWYGPIFGRKWMEILGVNPDDSEAKASMQKSARLLYAVQFLLTLFQVFILGFFLSFFDKSLSLEHSFWYWAAFVMPTVAGGAMWGNDSRKIAWSRFLIQSGYQLVLFLMFGYILSSWR